MGTIAKVATVASVVVLACATGACAGPKTGNGSAPAADVPAAAPAAAAPGAAVSAIEGEVTELQVGRMLEIALEGNASTGYGWGFEDGHDGAPQLRQRKGLAVAHATSAKTAPATPSPVGSPSVQHWTFEAVEPGESRIVLHYRRPWETAPPLRTAEYSVRVVAAPR